MENGLAEWEACYELLKRGHVEAQQALEEQLETTGTPLLPSSSTRPIRA